jgi:putative endopeptidase
MTKRFLIAASVASLALGTVASAKDVPASAPVLAKPSSTGGWGTFGVQTQYIDPATRPGDDFARYVNGKWLDAAEIPADRTRYGSFIALSDLSEQRMHEILEQLLVTKPVPGTPGARVAAAYSAFMDTAAIEKAGLAPIEPTLKRIAAAKTTQDLVSLFAEPSLASPFGLGVEVDAKDSAHYALYASQAVLGLPDRDYYLVDTPRNREIQGKYKQYLAFALGEAGYADPAKAAEAVYALETKMAAANWDRALGRNRDLTYNKLSVDEFAALAPEVPLKALLAKIGAGKATNIVVSQLPPTQEELAAAHYTPEMAAKLGGGVPALAKLVASEPVSSWQALLASRLIASKAAFLPARIDEATFAFYGTTLNGQPQQRPRWKRAISVVEQQVGELAGQLYAERWFPPANKAAMQTLVSNLRVAMAADLTDLKWMSPATRTQAEAKLAAFTPKIGYPDKYKTYDGLVLDPGTPLANSFAADRWETDYEINKIGKPVDKTEWQMFPQTVNAYYDPTRNEIVFPAAILQPPFFNLSADDAVNYGAIGAVIGHEMGHGFDDQGSKSDGTGNLRDWWTPADKAAFVALTDKLVAQYNQFCPFDQGQTCVNGRLTLGENIGDLGGVSLAYRAYRMSLNGKEPPVIDGFTGDQRFFMAYAQVWRQKAREATARQLLVTDPHSPPEYRVNGIVRNFDEWYKAFDVKPGDKLYLPPAQRLRIW